jgi:hypothetical protein
VHILCKVTSQTALLAAACLSLLCTTSEAIPVSVKDLGVDPRQTVRIDVDGFYTGYTYAGVVNLLVGGVAMDGFCIDPYHFRSSSTLLYNWVPLTQAPKPPGTMDASQAHLIAALWALAYTPTIGANAAAGLQIAIWEVIGGNDFTLLSSNDYGAAALLLQAQAYSGPLPDLIGLTGPGQDYVVAKPKTVPDGGYTVLLLGTALISIGCFAHRFGIAE